LAATLIAVGFMQSSARTGDAPMSFTVPVTDASLVETRIMDAVDVEALLEEDEERIASGIDGPWRFAAPHFVMVNITEEATLDILENGSRVWRLRVVSQGAHSVNFGFTTYELADGVTIHFYPAEQNAADLVWDGPYYGNDHAEEEFWSPVIPGDDVIIEVYAPASAPEPHIILSQVSHDYRDFLNKDSQMVPGACNNDVICPEGDPWRDEIRSGGTYTIGGTWICSGQMMNSLTNPKIHYFLTANHCGISTGNDQSVRVYWNKESPSCGMLCCGPTNMNQLGSTKVANYSPSDFTLIALTNDPDPAWNVYYAGWDATDDHIPQECTAIHHPGTIVKTISFNYDPLQITSYGGFSSPGNGTHWRIANWEDGTTEGGSSGSGIWDENRHVVGQLHGGQAWCGNNVNDWYGRLSRSWVGGGTAGSRLSDWLDPEGTLGETPVLDGWDPQGGSSSVDEVPAGLRAGGLSPVHPNPATAGVRIGFELASSAEVRLDIVDVSGRVVRTLPAKAFEAGSWQLSWDGRGAAGDDLGAGVYFVRMNLNGKLADTEKVILVR
jgi:hypothetical protein